MRCHKTGTFDLKFAQAVAVGAEVSCIDIGR